MRVHWPAETTSWAGSGGKDNGAKACSVRRNAQSTLEESYWFEESPTLEESREPYPARQLYTLSGWSTTWCLGFGVKGEGF